MMGGAALGVGFGMANAMGQAMAPGAHTQGTPPVVESAVTCPSCNAKVGGGRFCAECGSTLTPQPRFCASCGAPGKSAGKFCAECGTAYAQ